MTTSADFWPPNQAGSRAEMVIMFAEKLPTPNYPECIAFIVMNVENSNNNSCDVFIPSLQEKRFVLNNHPCCKI